MRKMRGVMRQVQYRGINSTDAASDLCVSKADEWESMRTYAADRSGLHHGSVFHQVMPRISFCLQSVKWNGNWPMQRLTSRH